MNRRTFLKTLSAIPVVGLVLPKEKETGFVPFSEFKNNCKASPLAVGDEVYGPDGVLYVCTSIGTSDHKRLRSWSTQETDWSLIHGLQEKR